MAEIYKKMSGWKTKYGSIFLGIGAGILGASDIAPSPELGEWMKFIGTLITGVGTATAAWGIGHKLDKNTPSTVIVSKAPIDASITKG